MAPRGEVNNALHTARARKCAAGAHSFITGKFFLLWKKKTGYKRNCSGDT